MSHEVKNFKDGCITERGLGEDKFQAWRRAPAFSYIPDSILDLSQRRASFPIPGADTGDVHRCLSNRHWGENPGSATYWLAVLRSFRPSLSFSLLI